MIAETVQLLSGWNAADTWIVVTAALAAMACALPGNYLVLRRQSLMGDALSHSVLLGIVLAVLAANWIKMWLGLGDAGYVALVAAAAFAGAVIVGVSTAVLTEWVRNLGRVEASAALGVVFTTLFALGIVLIRAAAEGVHIDLQCVLLGEIVSVTLDTWNWNGWAIPRAAVANGAMLAVNGLLVLLFFKELRLAAFDPGLATTQGINARVVNHALMAVTAVTIVAAFRSVGSILVIAMLIVPPAAAYLLTNRLGRMIGLSLAIAAASAVLGHVSAIVVPALLLPRLGLPAVGSASTAGMMAAASGALFVLALLFGPRHGALSRGIDRLRVSLRIAADDFLGWLYRVEENAAADAAAIAAVGTATSGTLTGMHPWVTRLATWRLRSRRLIESAGGKYRLTERGRDAARELVRAHRLWEAFMQKHIAVPDDHLHATAHRVEHFLDSDLRRELEAELDRPRHDPHGRDIPPE
ncbi:MAG: metal ABC transporter permease [Planctomycetaceae bacterium]